MEPVSAGVGLAVGVASLASIFQTCLHGYRTLNHAMEIGNTAVTLNIRFRVEELRLYLWGRSWGLAIELKPVGDSENPSVEDGKNGGEPVVTLINSGNEVDVDDDLDIPGLKDLTVEVLGRISKALDEWRTIGQRYPVSTDETSASNEMSLQTVHEIRLKQKTREDEFSSRTKLTRKLRWAVTDRKVLEELLAKLTSLNDILEKLLPRREKRSVARGLAGELLNLLDERNKSNNTRESLQMLLQQLGQDGSKAAKLLELKTLNQTEFSERDMKDEPSPFAKAAVWEAGEKENLRLSRSQFPKLVDPKLQYYHQQTRKGDG